jgi:hypothetical protein
MNKNELFNRLNDVRTDLDIINQHTNECRSEITDDFIKGGKSQEDSIEKWAEILKGIQGILNDIDGIKKLLLDK